MEQLITVATPINFYRQIMNNRMFEHFIKRPVTSGLFVFVALLLLTQFLSYQRYLIRKDADQREISSQATWTKERLQTVINYSFSATQTLAFFIEKYGVPQDFDSVARQLLNTNKYIDAIELVQGGVITNVYPLQGNEAVLGFNVLLDSARKSGAIAAIQKKGFFISGPINLKQGGAGFVSRIPIFKNNKFWGFSAALIKLPTLLEAAGIDTSDNTNFSYQLAKINSTTGQEEFFLRSRGSSKKEYSIPVEIPNGEWRLYITAKGNITFYAVFFFTLLGLLLSVTGGLFAWFIIKQPLRLNKLVQEKTLLLQTSEKNYRITLERIADAFVALDTNWCFTYMNSKAAEIFNCDPKSIIGKDIRSVFPGAAGQPFYEAYHKAMQQQQYIYIEEHLQSSERWFENHIYPSPEGLSVFFRDITGRKKTEQELSHSNERFQLISQATNDALWEWNFETGELWGNETHQQLFGLTMADPVPTEDVWKERIHPEDRSTIVDKQIISLSSNKSVFITEYRFRLPNNEYCFIYDRCYILRNAAGQPLRMLGSMMDVTERKKAEEQIIKEKELANSIINSLPGIFYLFDANRKLLRWNKNFESVTGYDAKEIVAVKPIDFYEGEGRKMVQENFTRVMMEGKSQFEANFVTKNGDKIPYFFTGLLVEYEGHPCLLGTGIDITLRKNAEQEIEMMNEQLRQLTRHLQNIREEERKRIAREIHDDLGQQLTGIKMGVMWVNKKIPDDAADIKNRLENIIALVDAGNVSVRKILNELRTDILDNYGLIEALQWQGQQFTATTDIPLLFDSPEEIVKAEEPVVTCIFRIFQEALTNITKYAHATQVTSSLTCTNNHIIFSIADNGLGFDTELLKTKNSFGVLGMRERVSALNGSFSLESAPGKGTSITITIPL
jgi:PAS domain S-box-containing protein